ncbi:MAG: site-specific integrase [Bryobacterales bacterium]|nr:site-specific integrase [Bryobacterales bacterium]
MKGHIVKRSEGSYSVVLELGKDPQTGRRLQKWVTIRGNKRAAERELARRLAEIHSGGFVDPGKITVAEFLESWLTRYAEPNVSPATAQRYRSIVAHHLAPALGSLPLARLTPLHIQAMLGASLKDGARKDGREGRLSPQSVLHHHRVLSEALGQAVRWQLLARNPCDAVEPPRVVPKEARALDEAETSWLLDCALGTRLYVPILLAVCGGLRRGEILALRWQDADLAAGTLRVWRSLEETRGGVRFKEPKAKRSRSLALAPLVVEALRGLQQDQARRKEALGNDYQAGDLICCRDDGSVWVPSAFTSAYRALLRRRNLKGPNFHALRHSHASQLLKAGVDIKVVQERLGHARAGFTYSVYAHILPGQDREAAQRQEEALRKAGERRPVARA